ncbi:predicted protein [Plenodomus lingam JN3]|uniref:Predicted protein n=1 Tax=Leptosphaeria maculans (strain JN3 / isolate v23.1.3 / race Av1-4-5-6-7-8) TaxID=985895 RepID=E4ZTI9_LEPMJ|nr:predicted protein [Plenodomus lingam JN3]CBX94845.1 predicted protein [Plenodomus lingam JN3]
MAIVESSRTTADSTIRRSEVGYACCQCTQRKRSRLSTVSTDNIETADCLGEGSSSSWARLGVPTWLSASRSHPSAICFMKHQQHSRPHGDPPRLVPSVSRAASEAAS